MQIWFVCLSSWRKRTGWAIWKMTLEQHPTVFDKSVDKCGPEFWKFSSGFWFLVFHSHHRHRRPPLQFLPLSDTNQNSTAFCNSAVMSLWELIRKWVDCRDFKGNVFKRWKKKSILLIKCISVEKRILQGRPSIRFHILLCCLIVSNKRRFGRVELHHFVRKMLFPNKKNKWKTRRILLTHSLTLSSTSWQSSELRNAFGTSLLNHLNSARHFAIPWKSRCKAHCNCIQVYSPGLHPRQKQIKQREPVTGARLISFNVYFCLWLF